MLRAWVCEGNTICACQPGLSDQSRSRIRLITALVGVASQDATPGVAFLRTAFREPYDAPEFRSHSMRARPATSTDFTQRWVELIGHQRGSGNRFSTSQ